MVVTISNVFCNTSVITGTYETTSSFFNMDGYMKFTKFVPVICFLASFIKSMIITPSVTEAVVLCMLGIYFFAHQYYIQSEDRKEFLAKFDEFAQKQSDMEKFLSENRLAIAGMKMIQARKPQ